jgi:hypothetical protein
VIIETTSWATPGPILKLARREAPISVCAQLSLNFVSKQYQVGLGSGRPMPIGAAVLPVMASFYRFQAVAGLAQDFRPLAP